MATLKELTTKYGEDKIVGMVESQLKAIERRKEYSTSPEAKAKATERRKKTAGELKAFREWKEKQNKK